MTIRTSTPPSSTGSIRVDFQQPQFDRAIFDKGYNVKVYRAVECPCKGQGQTNLTSCQNCLGLGWVFINPLNTKALITSINKNTKFKYWSPEFKGTVAASLRDVERLSFMDKIVLTDKTSILSEIRPIKEDGSQKFIFTSYPVNSIDVIYLFNGSTNSLIKVNSSLYNISSNNPYVVELDDLIPFPVDFNDSISVSYNHNVQYNAIDIPHDIRDSLTTNSNGKEENLPLPIQAICQKSHYITGDSPKFDGSGIKDNSYL